MYPCFVSKRFSKIFSAKKKYKITLHFKISKEQQIQIKSAGKINK